MTSFSVGEEVIILYGRHERQKGVILKALVPDAYKVRVEDGTILFFSSRGLEKDKGEVKGGS